MPITEGHCVFVAPLYLGPRLIQDHIMTWNIVKNMLGISLLHRKDLNFRLTIACWEVVLRIVIIFLLTNVKPIPWNRRRISILSRGEREIKQLRKIVKLCSYNLINSPYNFFLCLTLRVAQFPTNIAIPKVFSLPGIDDWLRTTLRGKSLQWKKLCWPSESFQWTLKT